MAELDQDFLNSTTSLILLHFPFLFLICFGLIVYWIAITLYRLYLHPLSKIPGPRLATLTPWYEFYYDVWQPGRYVFQIKELHKSYGPIIRVTPWEIHINDVDFLENIYTTSNSRKRDKDWTQTRGLDVGLSTSGTIAHDLHRLRREALQPFFSRDNVSMLETVIRKTVSRLCSHLDAAQASGKPANLSDLYYALARDIVFECSFGQKSNILDDEHEAAALRKNMTDLLLGVKTSKHFHWFFQTTRLLPAALAKHFVSPGVKNMRDLAAMVREAIHEVTTEKPAAEPAGTKAQRSVFHDILSSSKIPQIEKSPARLQSEGTMLVLAGTESTAKLLSTTHYHLLANPTMLSRVRTELSPLSTSTVSATDLQRLPYLSACISEGNRLSFGLTGRNARIAPEEDLSYGGYTIPAGTSVSMATLCIHTNENIFPDPWKFYPDRWLGAPGKALQKYQYGFGKGARRCLGMELANAEVFLTLAAVLRGYDMALFETAEEDVEFRHDFQVAHPKLDSKGLRVVVEGKLD